MIYAALLTALIAALPPPIAIAGEEALQIRNLRSGLCLDVPGARSNNHVSIQQYKCRSTDDIWVAAQLWRLKTIGDYVQIQNPRSGRCLDVPEGRAENHVPIQQYECRKWGDRWLSAQLWTLERINGYIQIRNLRTGLCLDVPAGVPHNYTILQQYNCRESGDRWIGAQLWQLR